MTTNPSTSRAAAALFPSLRGRLPRALAAGLAALFAQIGALRGADASTCSRWVNALGPCDGLVASNVCHDPSLWNDAQWRNYFNWIYADTAQDACYKQVLKAAPGYEGTAVADANAVCVYDYNDNGTIDQQDYSTIASPMALNTNVTREPVCDLVPRGPYHKMSSGPGTPGGDFSDQLRDDILEANSSKHGGVIKSDAGPSANPQPGTSDIDALVRNRFSLAPYSDDPTPITGMAPPANATSSAQIDHIIPRKDAHGCPCGPNDASNTLVISQQLNGAMSNKMDHPSRIKLLKQFVPGYVAPAQLTGLDGEAGLPDDGPPANAAPAEAAEIGGCSASAGGDASSALALGLGALGAAGAASRRRRRRG